MIDLQNQNNKNGFTFLEIIIAITIIGIVLISLFNLQSTLFNTAIRQHAKVTRIFTIKNVFFDQNIFTKLIKDKNFKKEIENPQTKLNSEMTKPKEKSSIKKFDNLYIWKTTGTWSGMIAQQEEEMGTLLFLPKPPTKQKQEKKQ